MDAQALVVYCPMGGSAMEPVMADVAAYSVNMSTRGRGGADGSRPGWSAQCRAPVEFRDMQACRISHGKNGLAAHGAGDGSSDINLMRAQALACNVKALGFDP